MISNPVAGSPCCRCCGSGFLGSSPGMRTAMITTLRDDPVFKLVAGDDAPGEQQALASQPTLSRFENQVTPSMLLKLVDFTINTGVERLKQHHGGQLPASLILDLDSTDDPTHGHQPFLYIWLLVQCPAQADDRGSDAARHRAVQSHRTKGQAV